MRFILRYSFYLIFVLYLLSAIFDVRGGYRSGDELGFLSGFSDRGVSKDWIDLRYWVWIRYVAGLDSIGLNVPIANAIFFFLLVFKLLKSKLINSFALFCLTLMPTVFYFSNSYLRDYAFFLIAIFFLLEPTLKISTFQGKLKLFLGLLMVMMRPVYGGLLVASIILSSDLLKKYYLFICLFLIFGIFFIVPISLLMSDSLCELFKNFYINGHVRGKPEFTVFMINKDEFTNLYSAFLFCFAFFKFWFLPTDGIGKLYDYFIIIEDMFLVILLFCGFVRGLFFNALDDRRYRMSVLMLIFSIISAAGITTDNDIYRFRIVFLIFAFYFAFYIRSPKKYISLGYTEIENRH